MKLSVDSLHRSYQASGVETVALRDVSFDVSPGEFVAIVGSSGSGKTTLLNSIGGLDVDFDGQVLVGEHSIKELSEPALARLRQKHLGFVFQHFNLLGHLTALENVLLPSYFAPAGAEKTFKKEAVALLERVGLGDRIDAMPSELSGGQRQRVAIARALLAKPSILLCDEPTGSLDRATGLSIMELFQELNRDEGITLLVITHEPYIADMAQRRITVEDGALVDDRLQTPKWPEPVEGTP